MTVFVDYDVMGCPRMPGDGPSPPSCRRLRPPSCRRLRADRHSSTIAVLRADELERLHVDFWQHRGGQLWDTTWPAAKAGRRAPACGHKALCGKQNTQSTAQRNPKHTSAIGAARPHAKAGVAHGRGGGAPSAAHAGGGVGHSQGIKGGGRRSKGNADGCPTAKGEATTSKPGRSQSSCYTHAPARAAARAETKQRAGPRRAWAPAGPRALGGGRLARAARRESRACAPGAAGREGASRERRQPANESGRRRAARCAPLRGRTAPGRVCRPRGSLKGKGRRLAEAKAHP
jgi:hypothetical protein